MHIKTKNETTVEESDIMSGAPYSLDKKNKEIKLTQKLKHLTLHHYKNCPEYKNILDTLGFKINQIQTYYDIPFLPVSLFKEFQLKSISTEAIFKTMTSSGTTGQQVSKIYLDNQTASLQIKVLSKTLRRYLGAKRLPMIILDSEEVIKNRQMFSARGAGILGFSMFGKEKIFALDKEMQLNQKTLSSFLEKHQGKPLFVFGFTFMIWQHFYKEAKRLKYNFDLSNATLIHGGGWKKLINQSVSNTKFKTELTKMCGITKIHDYYGMVEQTGTIHLECEHGFLHTTIFSDVIIRRPHDFSIAPHKEKGIIQVVSTVAKSYPGHSLLTEDEGMVIGEDDCACGRKGKYFTVTGRIKNAEIRGCSDTYQEKSN